MQAWCVPVLPTDVTPDASSTAILAADLVSMGVAAGLAAVGIAGADELLETRAHLNDRKSAGLNGGMQFTYRNPERSTDPERIVPGARSLVVGAWDYRRARPDLSTGHDGATGAPMADGRPMGRVARYSWQDHYAPLRDVLTTLADRLHADGWQAKVVCDDNALVDRAAAHRAGLGWFGRIRSCCCTGWGRGVFWERW